MSAAMGRPFMPHQRAFVDVLLEIQSEEAGDPSPGAWAYDDGTLTMQRRGGKTSLITPVVAHRARLITRASMFMTAQNREKAKARWMDVRADLRSSPLAGEVTSNIGNMNEIIRWRDNDSTLKPFAPNEDGLHSETPHLVVLDELWKFNEVEAAAIKAGYVPAMSTSGGQAVKMSTAGTETGSQWLKEVRRIGRRSVDEGLRLGVLFHEYSLPDRVVVDGRSMRLRQLSDEQLVEACIDHHPAVCHVPGCSGPRMTDGMARPCPHGFTVFPYKIRSAFIETNNRADFMRGYANRDANDVASKWSVVDEAEWLASIDGSPIPPSARVAFGVWVDEDGDDAAVAAGWRDSAGVMHVEHLHLQTGIRGIVSWVREKAERNAAAVAIANVGTSRDVGDELALAGIDVIRVAQADVTAACSRHRSELRAGSWKSAVSEAATAAAEAAGLELGRWSRPGDSVSALGAQTMAGWGIDHAPAPKNRRPFKVR